jgi:Choline dehydrogenase and related flavoproteins
MAASAIETVRLALLSDFPDRSGKLGRRLMLHAFIDGSAIFLDERMHAHRGRSVTQCAEDAADPDFPGARAFAKEHGLPYIRGGLMELGGTQDPIAEAQSYQTLLNFVRASRPFGTEFKQLMRASILRDRLAGCSLIGHDLPYLSHTVTLDPQVRDVFGCRWPASPGARASTSRWLQQFWIPRLKAMMTKGRRGRGAGRARHPQQRRPAHRQPRHGRHDDGDRPGRQRDRRPRPGHGLDNVYAADGSVFVTSGAHNPTNTIMAVALRNMRHLAE